METFTSQVARNTVQVQLYYQLFGNWKSEEWKSDITYDFYDKALNQLFHVHYVKSLYKY